MRKVILVSFISSLSAAGLIGCASGLSPVAITLTDLGTASRTEHSMTGLRVMRAVSVTGLGPNEVVGSISVDPDPPNAVVDFPSPFASKDYPDSLGLRLSPTCSRLAETTFLGAVTLDDVTTLRDGAQEVAELVTRKVRVGVERVALSEGAAILAKPLDEARKTEILKSLQVAFPNLALTDASKVSEVLGGVETEFAAIQHELKKKLTALKIAQQKPGIVVTRWSQEKSRSGTLDAVGAGAQGSKNRVQEGFLVLGSPRVTTLILGSDLVARVERTNPNQTNCGPNADCKVEIKNLMRPTRTYTTYYQLSAQHLAWGDDRSGASRLAIQADIGTILTTLDPLIKAGSGLSAILRDFQLKAAVEISRVYDFGNSGLTSGAKTTIFPFRFSDHDNYIKSLLAEQARAGSYRPIYSARATLERLVASKLGNLRVTDTETCSATQAPDYFSTAEVQGSAVTQTGSTGR